MLKAIATSGGGGGGSGTVTQVNTGVGLTGGPITTTGTISIANSTANTLAGYDNLGVYATIAPGTFLSLSGNVLNVTGVSPTLTFSTGLTNTANTITANLSTGISGGQTAIGGTGASQNLTLSSTSNATKGKILFGTSAYDELNNRLGIDTQSPTDPFHVGTVTTAPGIPASASGSITYGATANSFAPFDGGNAIRVYAYHQVGVVKQRSTSFAQSATLTTVAANGNYKLVWTWATVVGADGYLVLKSDDLNGYSYDVGLYFAGQATSGFTEDTTSAWGAFTTTSTTQTARTRIDLAGNLIVGTASVALARGFFVADSATIGVYVRGGGTADTIQVWNSGGTVMEFGFQPQGYFVIAPAQLGGGQYGFADGIRGGTGSASILCGGGIAAVNNIWANKNLGIGISSPSARLNIAAGTATVSTAPIKLTSGTNLTVIENGTFEYDGTHIYASMVGVRYPLDQPFLLSTTAGINAKSVANTALYTVPAGKTAIVTGIVVRCTAASAITVGPAAGVGNVAGTSNIFASAGMNALIGTTNIFGFTLVGMSLSTVAAGVIYLNLGTAATGTSQTIAVDLLGYLL